MFNTVVLVHYHLKTGGVTRVIEHQIEVLQKLGYQVHLISGEKPTQSFNASLHVIPEFAYHYSNYDSKSIKHILHQFRLDHKLDSNTIWWVHNPCLGKNVSLLQLCQILSDENADVLIQNHDYAEDGRAENYALISSYCSQTESFHYPLGVNTYYISINSRDKFILEEAGCPVSQSFLLPNAVQFNDTSHDIEPNKHNMIVYPTRAIRRKNMGEFIFWATIFPDETFAITLSPENEIQKPFYNFWIDFIAENDIQNVKTDVGKSLTNSFSSFLKGSYCCFSTSINEGFGQAYVEPVLMQTPVVGRMLPFLAKDFHSYGLDLSYMYFSLSVQSKWFNKKNFWNRQLERKKQLESQYRTKLHDLEPIGASIDFGSLDEQAQAEVILHIKHEPEMKTIYSPIWNEMITQAFAQLPHNAKQGRAVLDLNSYEKQIQEILTKVQTESPNPPQQPIQSDKIVASFLSTLLQFPLKSLQP